MLYAVSSQNNQWHCDLIGDLGSLLNARAHALLAGLPVASVARSLPQSLPAALVSFGY